MTLKILVRKLSRNIKKIITSDELKEDCKYLKMDYYVTIRYLTHYKYLARIFRGIFYVYSIEERKLGKVDMNFYDILAEALKLKGVKNWYFGLETALKFNNMTHEYFNMDFVMNDKIFKAKSMMIMGRKVRFYKVKSKLFSFGIKKDRYVYSDPEKTAIELVYLKHYGRLNFEEIAEDLSKDKIIRYSKNYDSRRIKPLLKSLSKTA
jgi:hypothetical protein